MNFCWIDKQTTKYSYDEFVVGVGVDVNVGIVVVSFKSQAGIFVC